MSSKKLGRNPFEAKKPRIAPREERPALDVTGEDAGLPESEANRFENLGLLERGVIEAGARTYLFGLKSVLRIMDRFGHLKD